MIQKPTGAEIASQLFAGLIARRILTVLAFAALLTTTLHAAPPLPTVSGPKNSTADISPPTEKPAPAKRIAYPEIARNFQLEGTVTLRLLIDANGRCLDHKVIGSPHPVLTSAVVSQLDKVAFEPARMNGQAVRNWVTVPFVFQLDR